MILGSHTSICVGGVGKVEGLILQDHDVVQEQYNAAESMKSKSLRSFGRLREKYEKEKQ